MSVRVSAWAWEQIRARKISHGKALVLLRLADHADNYGNCYPGGNHVAEYCVISTRATYTALAWFEEQGLLSRSAQQQQMGRGRGPDLIQLHIDVGAPSGDQQEATSGEFSVPPFAGVDPAAGAEGTDQDEASQDQQEATSGETSATNRKLEADQQEVGNRPIGSSRHSACIKEPSVTVNEPMSTNESSTDRSSDEPTRLTTPADRVFGAWVTSTGKRAASVKFTKKRRDLINRQLRDFDEDELVDAVCGWRFFAHNRGETNGTPYNDIELLLRDAAQIERFRDATRADRAKRSDQAAGGGGRLAADRRAA